MSSVPDAITIDQREAELITNLSIKTLERHALAGEPVGRVKIGRRVLYVKTQLENWLKSKMTNPANDNK